MESPAGKRPDNASLKRTELNSRSSVERKQLSKRILARIRPFAPLLALIVLSLLIGAVNPRFFEFRNIVRLASSAAIPMVLALGANFVIILGSVDLSVEGVMAIGSVVISLLVQNDRNTNAFGLWGPILAVFAGAGIGLLNGCVHVSFRIPSFMVSLGVWFVALGLATFILGGTTVRVVDPAFRGLALHYFLGFPLAVWLALAALALCWIIERFTTVGRYMYAIGGGEDLAILSGIPVSRVKVIIFTLAGALYAIGGMLAAAQLGQAQALIGNGRLFSAITAVVVGGTALSGGEGGVLNTLIGVLIISTLANGMVLVGISPYVQQAVQGILIIVAVALTLDRTRMKIVK
ncbi:MAG: ABC transporter permease [Verrucomicrobia bacterium]|nr:ABC transporter permease [Verrucomicrobiota bacterium]